MDRRRNANREALGELTRKKLKDGEPSPRFATVAPVHCQRMTPKGNQPPFLTFATLQLSGQGVDQLGWRFPQVPERVCDGPCPKRSVGNAQSARVLLGWGAHHQRSLRDWVTTH